MDSGPSAGRDEPPRALESDELDRALADLPGWVKSDSGYLSRWVHVQPQQRSSLLAAVEAVQVELEHQALIEKPDEQALVFIVPKSSQGSLSELDLQLVRRIEEAVGDTS